VSTLRAWLRPLLASCALLASLGSGAAAQNPDQRASLEAFRDSIGSTVDTAGLSELEDQLIAAAKADRNDPMRHLRLGFLALRLADPGSSGHYDDAASEFQWAIDLQPDWPYAWYGMGLAEYGIGDSQVTIVAGLKTMFGKDALARSAAAFAKTAEVDPSFVRGLVELSNTALKQRVNIKLDVALDALRRAAITEAASNPQVLLARGRVEREVGSPDSAVVAFTRYLQSDGPKPIGQLELARTQLWQGDRIAAAGYYLAAASDDSAVAAIIRNDLFPIAADSTLADYDTKKGIYRAAWLQQFWGPRDDLAMGTSGDRLVEHYRRWFYARRNFALVTVSRHFDIAERFKSGSQDFDDRGIIYVRHGEPTSRASFSGSGARIDDRVEPNLSWFYVRTDGNMYFHFVAREDVQDFRLVESLFDVLGYRRALQLQTGGENLSNDPMARDLIISRQDFAPIYQRLLNTNGGTSFQRAVTDERQLGQSYLARGVTTDTHEKQFPDDLDGSCQVLAVGSEGDRSLLHIGCAVRGKSLISQKVPQGYLYTVRLRFAAADRNGHIVARVDTTRRFVAAQPVPDDEYVVGMVTVPALASGVFDYRVMLAEGDSVGHVFPTAVVVAPPAQSTRLVLSDLVIGNRNHHLMWRPTPTDTVYLNPLGTFRRSETLELYYELIGADPFETHTTTLVVRKGSGIGENYMMGLTAAGSAQITLKFEDQAPRGRWTAQRSVSLEKLKPGTYTLEITVTAANGMKDVRRRAFRVVN
jgi:tetratricopeptide (TPR) repeat protein